MRGAATRLARSAASRLTGGTSASTASGGARRHAGDLPVKGDPHVEAWGTSREHIEEGFRFDSRTLRRGALWIVAVPLAIYWGVTHDFKVVDERAGKGTKDTGARKVMGGAAE